ncbi:MAG: NUDIX domain-containing protein [Chloroflexota bacterium]
MRARLGHDLIFMAGVMAVVINDAGEVLLQRRSDNGEWDLPGGILDPGEEPGSATVREVLEETGVAVVADRMIGIYAGPDYLVIYPNGDQVIYLQFVLACMPISGQAQVNDDESLEVGYFAPDAVPIMTRGQHYHIWLALENNPLAHFLIGAEKGPPLMSISDYVSAIRAKIGHDLLLMPGVGAVIINEAGHILMQLRSDNGRWGLPGGAIDPGEEPADAVIREVREETGLDVIPERIVGVYSGPDYRIRYPNGDEAMIVSITFACRPVSGDPRVNDDESLEIRYFAPDALPEMEPRMRFRIDQALRKDPRTHFRVNSAQENNEL